MGYRKLIQFVLNCFLYILTVSNTLKNKLNTNQPRISPETLDERYKLSAYRLKILLFVVGDAGIR